jgi:acyl carrier protein
MSIRDKVIEVISAEMKVNVSSYDFNMDIREQTDLDSMQFVALFARLEEEFKIDLPIQAMSAKSINDFIQIVEKTAHLPA